MKNFSDIDSFINQQLQDWQVPGLAVAVVKKGLVVFSKGYGYRDLELKLPVTEQTLFPIGSITKSFITTAMAMLVDEGKLEWDKPVRDYLPSFKLYDSYTTNHITSRDLVTHRSGLPGHNLLWYSSDFTSEEIVHRIRHIKPNVAMRTSFQYNNLLYITAGYLAGKLFGDTWQRLIQHRIFNSLHMQNSNFSIATSLNSADYALPYSNENGAVKRIPFYDRDVSGPAGAINSNIIDMSQYLLFHLAKGRVAGQTILSEKNIAEIHCPQIVTPLDYPFPELDNGSYGLGLVISSYRGHKLIHHGGGINGFVANFAFLPGEELGVIVLSNQGENPLPMIIAFNIFDRLLDKVQIPWSQRFNEISKSQIKEQMQLREKSNNSRKHNTQPSHALNNYTGHYQHPGYGNINIELDNNCFKVRFNQLSNELHHFHYDVFVTSDTYGPLQNKKFIFYSDVDGDINRMSVSLEPLSDEIVFNRGNNHVRQ